MDARVKPGHDELASIALLGSIRGALAFVTPVCGCMV
jgi:hypothetical protein